MPDYVLHAGDGRMQQVSAEKVRLPQDSGSVQSISVALGPDGVVYINRKDSIFQSEDYGRTWTSHPHGTGPSGEKVLVGAFTVLGDGSFIGLGQGREDPQDPMPILVSNDEGRSWEIRAQIEMPEEYQPFSGAHGNFLFAAADGTLLCPVEVSRHVADPVPGWDGRQSTGTCFRSNDGGYSWKGPSMVCHWWGGAEGGMAHTPSGKIVATVRYQRPLLPSDPPDLVEQNGGYIEEEEDGRSIGYPYKTVFMIDTHDGGLTWRDLGQVCTRFGQTRGYPAGLSDGTVVVVHDTRYGPGGPGSRALISRDEGMSWQDEVYYLDYSFAPGSYNASVVLEDDVILTVVGCTRVGQEHWGPAEATAIRWKPAGD